MPQAITNATSSGAAMALNQPSPAAQKSKFDKAATEFEGILINTLWSEFQNDPMASEDDSDAGGDTMRGMGLQAMSMAMAQSGGLGLGAMIEKQLGPAWLGPGASSATGTTPEGSTQSANIKEFLKSASAAADRAHRTESPSSPQEP